MDAVFVPAAELPDEAIFGLHGSFSAYGASLVDLQRMLDAGDLKTFVVGIGKQRAYLAVSVLETYGQKVLVLDGVWVPQQKAGWAWKTWVEFLKKLAADWDCIRVETCVKDKRLLKGILKLGAKVQHICLKMEL